MDALEMLDAVPVTGSETERFQRMKMRKLTEQSSLKRIAKKNKRKEKKRRRAEDRVRPAWSASNDDSDDSDSDAFLMSELEGPLPFERRVSQSAIRQRREAMKRKRGRRSSTGGSSDSGGMAKTKRRRGAAGIADTEFSSDSSDVIDTEDEMARLRQKGNKLLVARVEEKLKDEIGRSCNKDECVAEVARVILKHKQGGRRWFDDSEKWSPRYKELTAGQRADVPLVLSRSWRPCLAPDVSKIMETLGTPDQSRCWACSHSPQHTVKTDVSAWDNLTRMYTEHVGRMHKVTLAHQLHRYFEDNIRGPANSVLREGEEPVPEWRPVDILDHMEGHTNEPHLRVCTVLSQIQQFQKTLYNCAFVCNGTYNDVVRPDLTILKSYIDVTRLQMQVYNSDPSKMYRARNTSDVVMQDNPWVNMEKPGYFGNHPFALKNASM